jgi:ketopantoate hydroxymethyltransferase
MIGYCCCRDTDGQILVFHDLVANNPWFIPKHVHPLAAVGEAIKQAAREYANRLRSEGESST